MSVLIFVIILVVLILVHECGHFIVAKVAKIRVDEFGIGFPPRMFGFKPKNGETEYTFNWIPFGGFVRIFGENPNEEALHGPAKDRSFINKPKIVQAAVIVAGVSFNIVFAWMLISASFMYGLPAPVGTEPAGAVVKNPELTITEVIPDSPARRAGLSVGDVILALTADTDILENGSPEDVSLFIAAHGQERIALSFKHGETASTVFVEPVLGIVPERAALGISMSMIGTLQLPVHQALWEGAKTTGSLSMLIAASFWGLFADAFTGKGDLASLTGPVGIVSIVGDVSELGFIYLLGFAAFISINLAILNLIPFPALDGGRLLFLLIEAIKGSPIKPAIVNFLNTVGFALLIFAMLAVTYNDIVKLVTG